jgi:selenocysteine-specific elongation factor
MRVIGTAGHVDHGKSTLVAALTGIHPDRLKEEQAREMTIDLGFAWMTLPGGEDVGIVDVPGHRDFIENMLAGVGGIDAVLFVIAADEGVMPQTREHLNILNLLEIQGGVIALTKVDLVDDPDWIELVENDVREVVSGTILENAPIVPVSARMKKGLPELISALEICLGQRPHRVDQGRPRLPIDRVFTMAGFGTIVTGTLVDGHLSLGDEVEILPTKLKGRIRGLQSHKAKMEQVHPGSRVAVNISGVDFENVKRGYVLAHPGAYQVTQRIDIHFRMLGDTEATLHHNSEVKLFIGASEVLARVRLLGMDELHPGNEGWLQLELVEPVVAVRGDHYILRRPSPGETLGGGTVVNPIPKKRHKRFDPEITEQLEMMRLGSPSDLMLQAGLALGIVSIKDMVGRARISEHQAQEAIQELILSGQLIVLEKGLPAVQSDLLAVVKPVWISENQRLLQEVQHFHAALPLKAGIPREELKSRLKISSRVFNAEINFLVEEKKLEDHGLVICLTGHTLRFKPQEQKSIDGLLRQFSASPFSPPTVKECQVVVGSDIYNALVESGRLVQVNDEVVYRKEDYEHLVGAIKRYFNENPTLTVAEFRDQFQTSRRYALAFLEHLDSIGLTVREGDFRKLKGGKSSAK